MLGLLFLFMSLLCTLLLLLKAKLGFAHGYEALVSLDLFLTGLPHFLLLLVLGVLSFIFPFLLSSLSDSLFFGLGALRFILSCFGLLRLCFICHIHL